MNNLKRIETAPRRDFGRRCVMPEPTALEVEAELIRELRAARLRGDAKAIGRILNQLNRLIR